MEMEDIKEKIRKRIYRETESNEQSTEIKAESELEEDGSHNTDDDEIVKLYLITSDKCEACNYVAESLAEEIKSGEVIKLSLEKDKKAVELADLLDIDMVPEMVAEKADGRYCIIHGKGKIVRCAVPRVD